MKELVLNTISTFHYEMLAQAFSSQGLTVVERDNKRSQTKELVFYCSPEAYLLASKLSVAEPKSDDELLAEWQEQTEEQMDYVLSNAKECYLIDFDYALSDQDSFIQFLKCSVDIEISDFSALVTDKPALVEQCLLLIDDDIQQETYEDIISAADFYKKTEDSTPKARLHVLIGELQQQNEDVLLKNKEYIAESHLLQEKNAKLHEEQEENVARITELDKDKKTLLSENETLLSQYESLKEQHDQQQTEIKKLHELQQQLESGNELGLLQIAQLQEELEASFINNTELKGVNEKALAEKAALLPQYESIKEQHDQLKTLQQQLESDNELGLLQIAQLQEELETSFISQAELSDQNKALLTEKENLEAALLAQTVNNSRLEKELTVSLSNNAELLRTKDIVLAEKEELLSQYESLKAQYDQQQADKDKLQAQCQQLESDTELGLLQIAQLQEELETSFISNTELSDQNKARYLQLESDTELGLLQITQLQEELEVNVTTASDVKKELVIEKEQIKIELDQKKDELTQLYEKYAELETDNELGLLQIAQLQEELEFYYMKLQENGVAKFREKSEQTHLAVIQKSLQLAQHLKNKCA